MPDGPDPRQTAEDGMCHQPSRRRRPRAHEGLASGRGPGHQPVGGGAPGAARCRGGAGAGGSGLLQRPGRLRFRRGRQCGWQPHRDGGSHRAFFEPRLDLSGHAAGSDRDAAFANRRRRGVQSDDGFDSPDDRHHDGHGTGDDGDRPSPDGHDAAHDGDRSSPDGHGRPGRHSDHHDDHPIEPSRSGGRGGRCRCGGRYRRFTVRGFGERAGMGLGTDWRMPWWRRGRAGRVRSWPTWRLPVGMTRDPLRQEGPRQYSVPAPEPRRPWRASSRGEGGERRRPEKPLLGTSAVGAGTASLETNVHHGIAAAPPRKDRRP